jgi:hypothetical protein
MAVDLSLGIFSAALIYALPGSHALPLATLMHYPPHPRYSGILLIVVNLNTTTHLDSWKPVALAVCKQQGLYSQTAILVTNLPWLSSPKLGPFLFGSVSSSLDFTPTAF